LRNWVEQVLDPLRVRVAAELGTLAAVELGRLAAVELGTLMPQARSERAR
jgi:hypothetical protein